MHAPRRFRAPLGRWGRPGTAADAVRARRPLSGGAVAADLSVAVLQV
jgi:hypothetical protein